VKVAAIQHDITWEDRDATLAHVTPMVATAAAEGARLVVLPEMFAVGFSMTPEATAEATGGPTSQWLVEQARTHDIWIGGSVPERGDGRPQNVFVLAAPDGTVHRYAKVHPFTYSGEHEHYDAGDALVTVDVDGLRVSLFVCYDLRFADEFWGLAERTHLYLVVASWPVTRSHHWRSLLLARAIENQAYVLGCNRVGDGDGTHYAGGSCIVDPMGLVLASKGDHEAVVFAEVDAATVVAARERFPFLRDRRR
jgi:predicted amidohydrolase